MQKPKIIHCSLRWGQTMGTGWDTVLKQAAIPILEQTYCRSYMGAMVSSNMICAGYDSGDHGGCMVSFSYTSILQYPTCICTTLYSIRNS